MSWCLEWIRLWHQLTKKLFEFFDHPEARPYRVEVFQRFVRDFETKINQLRLSEMGVKVAKDIDSMSWFLNEYCRDNSFETHLRSPNTSELPNIAAFSDRYKTIERIACAPTCIDCPCKIIVWRSWRNESWHGWSSQDSWQSWERRQRSECRILQCGSWLLQGLVQSRSNLYFQSFNRPFRQRQNMHRTTRTHCSISHALTSRRTCYPRSGY